MNAKILYVCAKSLQHSRFVQRFVKLCKNNGNSGMCLTGCDFGFSTLGNKRKQGYDALFVDYETIAFEVALARRANRDLNENHLLAVTTDLQTAMLEVGLA